jgi:hypothetical protein
MPHDVVRSCGAGSRRRDRVSMQVLAQACAGLAAVLFSSRVNVWSEPDSRTFRGQTVFACRMMLCEAVEDNTHLTLSVSLGTYPRLGPPARSAKPRSARPPAACSVPSGRLVSQAIAWTTFRTATAALLIMMPPRLVRVGMKVIRKRVEAYAHANLHTCHIRSVCVPPVPL